ncbi:hypothetical protein Ciccas_011938 [Cichlidogyrus casuarinus]|uniref:Uncharacterized protein n=1 Tax=Cichlidogyrus casuarinus TaxID=1844966 RepID=A0ABD2PUR7_9PLAT
MPEAVLKFISLQSNHPVKIHDQHRRLSGELFLLPSHLQPVKLALPGVVLRLLCNRIYMVTTLTITFEMFTIIGFSSFLPKYLEKVYQIRSTAASLLVG